MPINVSDLRRTLRGKLGFQMEQGKKHERYTLIVDGQWVAQTFVSRGRSFEVQDGILRQMAGQLNVTWRDFKAALDCNLSGEDFQDKVKKGSA